MCSLFGIAISTRAALTGYRLSVDRITRIAKNLDAFNRLDITDQELLLKENADLLVSLRGAIFFESRKKGIDQVNIIFFSCKIISSSQLKIIKFFTSVILFLKCANCL